MDPDALTLEQALRAFPCPDCSRPGEPSVGVRQVDGRWAACHTCRGDLALQADDIWRDTPPVDEAQARETVGRPLPARYLDDESDAGDVTFDRATGAVDPVRISAAWRNHGYVLVCRGWSLHHAVRGVRRQMRRQRITVLQVPVWFGEFDVEARMEMDVPVYADGRPVAWTQLAGGLRGALQACAVGMGELYRASAFEAGWMALNTEGIALLEQPIR